MSNNTKTKRPFNWKALVAVLVVVVLLVTIWVLSLWYSKWNFNDGTNFFIKRILVDNFLGVNAVLIGLLILVGYLILGRGVTDSLVGMLKGMIGVLILSIGAGTLVKIAKPIFNSFKSFGTLTPLDPYLGWTSANNFLGQYVSWVSYALIIGLFVNILLIVLRKWTNVHSLMVTGHVMFQQAAMVVAVVALLMFAVDPTQSVGAGLSSGVIIVSGILLGTYWGVASTATIKGSDVVTQGAGFAVGHQQMFGVSLAYGIGKFFGKKEDSAETKKLSNKIKIFEDNIFTQSLIILVVFLILVLILQFAGPDAVKFANLKTGKVNLTVYSDWNAAGKEAFWVTNLVLTSLKLVGSILVLQMGVRMFVTELQQSFQGISEKLVPGAVVAVDVAATYGFSPNSVTYGFISGTIGQFIAVALTIGLYFATKGHSFEYVMVIPLFITLFFNSGSIGVFANASGGFKASIIVPALFGFVEILVVSLGLSVMKYSQAAYPFSTGYIGMFDWNVAFGSIITLSSWSKIAAYIVFPAYIVLMLVLAQIVDSNRQSKPTFMQKAFNIKPNLEFAKAEAEFAKANA
ncbi:PTS ascorbate transporter subunit IIC [Mycoplasmopsis lipofaciens]|uniref:PTS ascorbate transporter subunit IIC n=1 Tax=Mycoplasmopsis lipofaciens TaxID=114884 RepID=UPI00048068FF|nr:PTS ascorbate transporter subunit IIC [Mycoplasmopsis lipofaciens]